MLAARRLICLGTTSIGLPEDAHTRTYSNTCAWMGEVLFNSLKCHRDLPATRISPEQHCILKHRWKKAANRESPCKMLKGSLLAMKQLQTDQL